MKFEEQPQPNPVENPEPQGTKSPDQASDITIESKLEKKESIALNFDAIKNIIISQIGSKAEIKRLEIDEVAEGAKLTAEIDAGMLGGQISIEGRIVNVSDGIAIHDLSIDARGYVKSRIENTLSNFGPAIKKYFEKKYRKLVSSIQIVGSSLVIDLENTLEANKPRDNKTQIEQLLKSIDNMDPWERTGVIEDYCKDFIRLRRYEDARMVAGLLRGEKRRNAIIDNIDKIEQSGM